jgi:hypothetical protein
MPFRQGLPGKRRTRRVAGEFRHWQSLLCNQTGRNGGGIIAENPNSLIQYKMPYTAKIGHVAAIRIGVSLSVNRKIN